MFSILKHLLVKPEGVFYFIPPKYTYAPKKSEMKQVSLGISGKPQLQ